MGGGVCLFMGALPGGGSKKKSIKGILKGLLIYYTYKLPLIRAVNDGICLFVIVIETWISIQSELPTNQNALSQKVRIGVRNAIECTILMWGSLHLSTTHQYSSLST